MQKVKDSAEPGIPRKGKEALGTRQDEKRASG